MSLVPALKVKPSTAIRTSVSGHQSVLCSVAMIRLRCASLVLRADSTSRNAIPCDCPVCSRAAVSFEQA